MSLLSLCADAAAEVGIPSFSLVVGNTDPAVQTLARLARRTGADLVARGSWQALRKLASYAAPAGEAQPALPADFHRMVPETFWDRTNHRLISGPLAPVEWSSLKGLATADAGRRWFTLRGGALVITPAMSGGETLEYEYYSRHYCQSASGVTQSAWAADTDTARISEELFTLGVIAAWLRTAGLPYEMEQAAYERLFDQEQSNDWPDVAVLMAGDIFGGGRHQDGAPGTTAGASVGGGLGSASGTSGSTLDLTWGSL